MDTAHALEMSCKTIINKIDPKLPNSLAGTGKVYTQEGRPEEAVSCFQRPVDIQPDSAKIHFQLGQAYLKMGQLTKAQREIAEAGRLQAQLRSRLLKKCLVALWKRGAFSPATDRRPNTFEQVDVTSVACQLEHTIIP